MKLRNSVLLITGLLLGHSAMASCTWDDDPNYGGARPIQLEIGDHIIRVNADAALDSVIDTLDSNQQSGTYISYKDCVIGELYGRGLERALVPANSANAFKTQIDGIDVIPQYNNSAAFSFFPATRSLTANRLSYFPGSFFRLDFVKSRNRLRLTDPNGDIVLSPGLMVRNWVNSDSTANRAQWLNIGTIRIISTPSCTFNGAKTVDFNQVGTRDLQGGVTRDLDFSVTCATDYGNYSVNAALLTSTPNADGTIPVTDASSATNRMKIQISNNSGTPISADGSQLERQANITDSIATNYKWKATLLPGSGAVPEEGAFTARAEILLQVD